MNNHYKKAIAVFGIVIPISIMLMIIVFTIYKSNSIKKEYTAKKAAYMRSQSLATELTSLEKQANKCKDETEHCKQQISSVSRGDIIKLWSQISSKYRANGFTKVTPQWGLVSNGLGLGNTQSASSLKMSLKGTFSDIQQSLLELETQLPQLQLDEMSLSPSGDKNRIKADTTFTLWTE